MMMAKVSPGGPWAGPAKLAVGWAGLAHGQSMKDGIEPG